MVENKKMENLIFLILILLNLFPINAHAARGCCSHHGGVSYCGNSGYYICNDGTQSPSCSCSSSSSSNYNDNIYGGVELTDTSCDYSRYNRKIEKLENEIDRLKNDLDNSNYNFYCLLAGVGIYVFYKLYKRRKNSNN